MVLPEGCGEVAEADVAEWLLLVELLALGLEVWVDAGVPGRVMLTNFLAPPTAKDLE